MRKISLAVSLAALLAASPAFAGNEDNQSTIKQLTATDSTVNVEQLANTSGTNESYVTQHETKNATAKVYQKNYGNKNESTIDQYGKNVKANVNQNNNGTKNESIVVQDGTGNSTELSKVDVDQVGSGNKNYSKVNQKGKDSKTTVLQNGVNNDNDSDILQHANRSTIKITQGGNTNNNDSLIKQTSDDSSIVVSQGVGRTGITNWSDINQSQGNNNHIVLNQH